MPAVCSAREDRVTMTHPASLPIERLLDDCTTRNVRRSGPGGQHRNKVESGVILRHDPTGVSAEASERRTRLQNHVVAVNRLRRQLALDVRASRQSAQPSIEWRSRVRQQRIEVNPHHVLFPTLLAEALDALDDYDWEISAAADWLGTTTSQLVKFLKLEPRAFTRLNQERSSRDLKPLR